MPLNLEISSKLTLHLSHLMDTGRWLTLGAFNILLFFEHLGFLWGFVFVLQFFSKLPLLTSLLWLLWSELHKHITVVLTHFQPWCSLAVDVSGDAHILSCSVPWALHFFFWSSCTCSIEHNSLSRGTQIMIVLFAEFTMALTYMFTRGYTSFFIEILWFTILLTLVYHAHNSNTTSLTNEHTSLVQHSSLSILPFQLSCVYFLALIYSFFLSL